jgi:predicted outer membrane repeat protein
MESVFEATFQSSTLFLEQNDKTLLKIEKLHGRDLGGGNFSWTGKITGSENSTLSFTRVGHEIVGGLKPSFGAIQRFITDKGKVIWLKTKKSNHLSCGGCLLDQKQKNLDPRPVRRAKNWRDGDGNLIDLLVAYTSDAKLSENLSTESQVEAYLQNAISESNLCFLNSNVNAAIRLVHLVEIDYAETQDPSMDLNRSTNPTDGYLDQLHTLRDQYGADLVSVLISQGDGSLGGIANTMSYPSLDFGESGFNVVVIGQIGAPSYSLLHEIGHNMGCTHNREDAMDRGVPDTDPSNNSLFKQFNYGKRWITNGQGYRTIMAYDTDGTPTYTNRIPYFSNPSIAYQGISTGNLDSEDNAQVLNTTTPYVSNFRSSIVQGIVPSIYSLNISEGNASSLTVRLASKPESNVSISISLDSAGDQDFSLLDSSTMTFSPESWNLPQPLQLISKKDADANNGISTIYLSSTGIPTTSVALNEIDTGSDTTSYRLITGVIKDSQDVGVPNVSLSFSSVGTPILTDENGTFFTSVSSTWSGTITASKAGHQFSPDTLSISSDTAETIQLTFLASRSQILYVDATATGNGDGSSWANAYPELSTALQSMHPFTEVWVASGTYKPGVFRSDFFLLPPNVSIYGGFSGSESSRQERNSTTNQTILSGDIGNINDGSDNTFHVVVPSNGSHLEGFIVQDGNASENYSDSRGKGGGLYAHGVNFSISECIFQGNRARQRGGAAYLLDTNATFSNCTFSNNRGSGLGSGLGYAGAIYSKDVILVLNSCQFNNNQADLDGGAIFAEYSEINATSCTFSGNQNTTNNGGGAWALKFCTLIENHGTYTSNYSASSGGSIDATDSNITITYAQFSSNQSLFYGAGGQFIDCNTTISSSLFSGNSANSNGGALFFESTPLTLKNNTFTSNQSAYSGGAVFTKDGNFSATGNSYQQNSAGTSGGAVAIENGTFNESSGNYQNNTSIYDGGGLHLKNSTGTLNDSNFSSNSNTTYNGGGALSLEGSSPSISGCSFTKNFTVSRYGGAIYMNSTSTPSMDRCSFVANHATASGSYGGALYFWGNSNVQISNSLFLKNHANDGGAFTSMGASNISFLQCRFIGNEANASSASEGGVGLLASDANQTKFINCLLSDNGASYRNGVLKPIGHSRFVNCTLVRNTSIEHGGISIVFSGQSIDFENSILWQNSAGSQGSDLYNYQGSVSANHCILDPSKSLGTISGSDNNDSDPLFIDSDGSDGIAGNEDDDYNLQATSPAIDQASTGAQHYTTTDILGKTRYGNGPDIGAYEYRVNSAPVIKSGSTYSLSSDEDETASYPFAASDIDGDDLIWSISSPASNGTVSISKDSGLASYQPNLNWYGTDSFSVSVSDGASIATVIVSVSVASVDDLPVLSAEIPDQFMNEDQGNLSIDLSEFFNDPDSLDSFRFSATSSDESLAIPTISGSDLILSILSNQFGTATISIIATSGDQSVSDSFILEVQSVNDPPTLSNAPTGAAIKISESSTYLFDFNATDNDGDSLTFTLSGSDSSFFELNASSGVIRFKVAPDFETPLDSDQNNSYELSVVVSDQSSSSQPFSLLVSIIDLDEYAWSTAVDHGNHWRSTDWFGTYFETSSNWIFHVNHGWLYRNGTSMSSFWLYDSNLDWLWTNFENYPYLFRSESAAWIFFQNDSGSRKFYDYSTNSWTTLPAN